MALPLPQHSTTMEKLPNEVLSDIFIRLLAKQLARMRCICKSWNVLLSETSFIKSHLHRSIHHNDEILLFFQRGFSFGRSSFTARLSPSPNPEVTNFIEIPTIPQHNRGWVGMGRVIGSVNGLICFCYGSFYGDHAVYIWNPSLSVVLSLPPCSLPSNNMIDDHFRFGYEPKTDDYKVVKLTSRTKPCRIVPQVEVYSMKKGSWELITQRFPSHIIWICEQDEVCVDGHDGHVHWLGDTDLEWTQERIVAFDLGAETFREIPLPDSIICHHVDRFNVLGVLGGKLCVISSVEDGGCEVWVMDEYGVPESWVKHHVFSQFSRDITPYGFTSRNEFLFEVNEDDNRFGLFDPIAAKTTTFKINGVIDLNKIVDYLDSLVWVAPAKCEA